MLDNWTCLVLLVVTTGGGIVGTGIVWKIMRLATNRTCNKKGRIVWWLRMDVNIPLVYSE
jgi:hypothetical protein